MSFPGQRLVVLPGVFAVCRLDASAAVPAWVAGPFYNVTSTADEVSVVCESHRVPEGVKAERGWRILKVVGPFDFGVVGVMASLASPLAQARSEERRVGKECLCWCRSRWSP